MKPTSIEMSIRVGGRSMNLIIIHRCKRVFEETKKFHNHFIFEYEIIFKINPAKEFKNKRKRIET